MLTRGVGERPRSRGSAEEDPRQDPAGRQAYSRLEFGFVKNYFESEVRQYGNNDCSESCS